jgi:hypothetical protein
VSHVHDNRTHDHDTHGVVENRVADNGGTDNGGTDDYGRPHVAADVGCSRCADAVDRGGLPGDDRGAGGRGSDRVSWRTGPAGAAFDRDVARSDARCRLGRTDTRNGNGAARAAARRLSHIDKEGDAR